MPFLPYCCCNCRLAVGTAAIGWAEFIISVLAISFSSIGLSNADALQQIIAVRIKQMRIMDDDLVAELVKSEYRKVLISAIIYLTVKVLMLIPSILLVIAARQRVRLMLVPYLIIGIVNLLYNMMWVILRMAYMGHAPENSFMILVAFFMTSLFLYFWLVVFSYYQELKESSRPNLSIRLQPQPEQLTIYQQPRIDQGFDKYSGQTFYPPAPPTGNYPPGNYPPPPINTISQATGYPQPPMYSPAYPSHLPPPYYPPTTSNIPQTHQFHPASPEPPYSAVNSH